MTSSLSDLRLAIRGLRRGPLFATVAILSLALGIGANTAIFTLIDQILLRKLPIVAPEQLVMLYQPDARHRDRLRPSAGIAGEPLYEMKTVEGQLDETLLTDRLIAMLSAGLGLVATLLASVGLYGVMACVVAQRKKELAIRLALGARPSTVLLLTIVSAAAGLIPELRASRTDPIMALRQE